MEKFHSWTQLLHCENLKPKEKVVLGIILDYNNLKNEGKWNNTTQQTIIKETSLSKPTVRQILSALKDKGLVKITNDVYRSADDISPIPQNIELLLGGKETCPITTPNRERNLPKIGKETCPISNQEMGKELTQDRERNLSEVGKETYPNTNNNNTNTKKSNIYNTNIEVNEETECKPISEANNAGIEFLENIDRLEQQYNYIPTDDRAILPRTGGISAQQVKDLNVSASNKKTLWNNLQTLVKASEDPKVLITSLLKCNDFLLVWRKANQPICKVYANALQAVQDEGSRLTSKQRPYAKDLLKQLEENIIKCGGAEMLNEYRTSSNSEKVPTTNSSSDIASAFQTKVKDREEMLRKTAEYAISNIPQQQKQANAPQLSCSNNSQVEQQISRYCDKYYNKGDQFDFGELENVCEKIDGIVERYEYSISPEILKQAKTTSAYLQQGIERGYFL